MPYLATDYIVYGRDFGYGFHRYVRDLIYYSKSSNASMMLSVIYEKGVEEKLYVWLSIMCDGIIEMNFWREKIEVLED